MFITPIKNVKKHSGNFCQDHSGSEHELSLAEGTQWNYNCKYPTRKVRLELTDVKHVIRASGETAGCRGRKLESPAVITGS